MFFFPYVFCCGPHGSVYLKYDVTYLNKKIQSKSYDDL